MPESAVEIFKAKSRQRRFNCNERANIFVTQRSISTDNLHTEILPDQHQFTDQFGLCFPFS